MWCILLHDWGSKDGIMHSIVIPVIERWVCWMLYVLCLSVCLSTSSSVFLRHIAWIKPDLARLANLTIGLYILLALISFFSFFIFLMIAQIIIISRSTGPIFAIFSPYENTLGADDRSGPRFRFVKGRCHGNQIILRESNECRLTLPAFFALAFENQLEHHYLYVRINSNDDQGTSAINLVGFLPEPLDEFTRIICVQQASFSTRGCLSTFARC